MHENVIIVHSKEKGVERITIDDIFAMPQGPSLVWTAPNPNPSGSYRRNPFIGITIHNDSGPAIIINDPPTAFYWYLNDKRVNPKSVTSKMSKEDLAVLLLDSSEEIRKIAEEELKKRQLANKNIIRKCWKLITDKL